MNLDLYCQRCGEPHHMDSVNFDFTPEEKEDFLAGRNCPACRNKVVDDPIPFRSELQSMMMDIMGDDLDGVVSGLDDAEYLLGQEFWQ